MTDPTANPANIVSAQDFWDRLRATTPSRIGLARTGDAVTTRHLLEFRAAHAAARDAVHEPLDVESFTAAVAAVGLGEPVIVTSRAAGRGEYLRRPDFGRQPLDLRPLDALPHGRDIAVVLADGLSARALADHGAALLRALVDEFAGRWSIGPPVIAIQARVALGDHIGAALGVGTLIVVIGERPGLSVADSLGIYLTQAPRVGLTDADRNCVSNIHPPGGLGYREAARVTANLVAGARALGRSGVTLKDTSRPALAPGANIAFRRVTPDDFGLLATWLSHPHVHRWWCQEFSPEAVERDFGPSARGEEPNEDLLALLSDDGRPVGLVQRSFWHDYPEYVDEVAHIVQIPADAVTIDYLIGELADTGRGLGPAMIEAVVADTWLTLPRANSIIVPIAAGNRASWRTLEKAGFRRIAEGDLEPDNPIDPPAHVIYRLDRPPRPPSWC